MIQWLKFVNQGGIPAMQNIAVTDDATAETRTFSFNDHPYRQTHNFYGFFAVKFPNPITATETTGAYTVKFDTQGVGGSSVDVYYTNGEKLTVSNLASVAQTVHLFFYDRDSNRVQLIR